MLRHPGHAGAKSTYAVPKSAHASIESVASFWEGNGDVARYEADFELMMEFGKAYINWVNKKKHVCKGLDAKHAMLMCNVGIRCSPLEVMLASLTFVHYVMAHCTAIWASHRGPETNKAGVTMNVLTIQYAGFAVTNCDFHLARRQCLWQFTFGVLAC